MVAHDADPGWVDPGGHLGSFMLRPPPFAPPVAGIAAPVRGCSRRVRRAT